MAVTRTYTSTIASTEASDHGNVDVTLRRGLEVMTVELTADEARQLADELTAVATEADVYAAEKAAG